MSNYSRFTKPHIINISFIVMLMHLINSQFFKSYQLNNEDLLIIDSTGISVKDALKQEIKTIIYFEGNEGLTLNTDFYDVTLSQFPVEKGGLLECYTKQKLYIISNDYKTICNNTLKLSTEHEVIIPYVTKIQEGTENYYFIISFVSKDGNNEICIHRYYYNIDNCENNLEISNKISAINSLGTTCKVELRKM